MARLSLPPSAPVDGHLYLCIDKLTLSLTQSHTHTQ